MISPCVANLTNVSASSFLDEQGNAYFKGYIELPRNYVEHAGQQYVVTPGMTVVADIKTGEKTLFEYLMKPITKAYSESFTER